jgi:hypothetical protein
MMVSKTGFDCYGHVLPSHLHGKEDLPFYNIHSLFPLDTSLLQAHGSNNALLGQKSPNHSHRQLLCLVGNVADMTPRVITTTTMSAENCQRHNVANAVTGFVAGSPVVLDIYLVFFYLDIYMIFFSLLNNSKDVSIAPTIGTGRSN